MSSPFSYLLDDDNGSQSVGNTASDVMDVTDDTTATLTDGGSTHDGIDTPGTTDDGIDTPTASGPADNGFRGTPASSVALPEPAGTWSAPEPTVLLSQIQQAAEDVSQLVERFGSKMAKTVQRPAIKKALFADLRLLRLPCLQWADNFTCHVTRFSGKPFDYNNSAPLLWWLWDELLEYLQPSAGTRNCKLEFTPVGETSTLLPYTISIYLDSKNCNDSIWLTASYDGSLFHERRTFDVPIAKFCFPEAKRYGKPTMATLSIDRYVHEDEEGHLDHTLDYLMPRPGSIWRQAMKAFPIKEEEANLVIALAGTCKVEDGRFSLSEDQVQQYLNLLQRFPPKGREYVINIGLV
ncbi:hypothetical protein F5Y10DRAFT_271239 [Nemania abortiva]|nr:hypothetical protein F5Y10DRAFT_271239 [Nemania abortiva]